MLSKETIAAAKKSVKERLKRKGIAVYFVAFEIDGGYPYFVYAFDREIAEEAKKIYSDGYVKAEAFDDYAMDKDADPIKEITEIIERRFNEWRKK